MPEKIVKKISVKTEKKALYFHNRKGNEKYLYVPSIGNIEKAMWVFNCLDHGLRTPNEGIKQRYLKNWAEAQWASYVVGGITHLKVKKLLDFAKSQTSEEKLQGLCFRPLVLIFIGTKNMCYYWRTLIRLGRNHVI